MDIQEKVLEIVKQKGPVLPIQISKGINKDLTLSSAILSELVSNKKIKYSNAKIGSSPLYYLPGQEPKLQSLFNHLHEKEQHAFNLLKEKKILIDSLLNPIMRVALRQIKDFAAPLEVNISGKQEIIWKWYTLPNNEVNLLLKLLINKEKKQELQKTFSSKTEPVKKTELTKQETKLQPHIHQIKPTPYLKEDTKPKLTHPLIDTQHLKEKLQKELGEELLKELKEQLKKEILTENKKREKTTHNELENELKKKQEEKDPFLDKVKIYLDKTKIDILFSEIIKKNKEIELTIKIPSAIGGVIYHCIAKQKKKINYLDINLAHAISQQKKLPILFLTTGDLSKKTQEALDNEFKGLVLKRI